VQAQGGYDADDALVTRQNVYDFSQSYADKLKLKGGRLFVNDPKKIDAKKAAEAALGLEAPPSPAEVEMMAEQAKEQAKIQGQIEVEKFKAGVRAQELQLELQKFQAQLAANEAAAQRAHELALAKLAQDANLAQQKLALDMTIHREKEARENKKIDTESQYVLIEQEKAAREERSEELRADLAARETAARERNDTLKIEADERKIQREEVMDMRKIALEDRKLNLEERRLEMEAAAPPEAPAPAPAPQPSDKGGSDAMAAALLAVAASMNRPKTATRPDGSKITIE